MIDFEYLFPIILIFIGVLGETFFNLKISKTYYYFIVFWIVLVAGFRYAVGPDWPGYYFGYNILKDSSNSDILQLSDSLGFEVGYVFISWLVSRTGYQIWAFNLIFAGISILLKTSTILKYSKFYLIGLLLYYLPLYFFEDIIQIRQGFATGVTIFSIRYIISKEKWKFLVCILLAYQFHHSAFIFLPAYWIANIKLEYKYVIIIVLFFVITSPFDLSKNIRPIMDLLPIKGVQDGYNSYVDSGFTGSITYSFADVVKLSFFILTIIFNNICEPNNKDNSYKIVRNLYAFSILLYFFFHGEGIFAIRLSGYYASTVFLIIPITLYYIREYSNKNFVLVLSIFIIYIVIFYFRFQFLNGNMFEDYTNFIYNKINKIDRQNYFN